MIEIVNAASVLLAINKIEPAGSICTDPPKVIFPLKTPRRSVCAKAMIKVGQYSEVCRKFFGIWIGIRKESLTVLARKANAELGFKFCNLVHVHDG